MYCLNAYKGEDYILDFDLLFKGINEFIKDNYILLLIFSGFLTKLGGHIFDYSKKIIQSIFSNLKSKAYVAVLSDKGLNKGKSTLEKSHNQKNPMICSDGRIMHTSDGSILCFGGKSQ